MQFSNNAIDFNGNTISFNSSQSLEGGGTSNSADLYNLYMQPTSVQWSNDEGGDVIGAETSNSRNVTQVLIGNKTGKKGSANIKGGNADVIAFIGAGDKIDAGGGDNYIEITSARRGNSRGAQVVLNETSGQDVLVGFNSGYDENSDRISVSNSTVRPDFKFINGRLVMQNSNRRVTFQNTYGSSSDSENDIGNVSKILLDTDNGEEKYAIADSDSTIKVNWYDAADVYIGNGSTSGVDFGSYDNDIEINLGTDKFQNIGNVRGSNGTHSIIGSSGMETLNAGNGRASLWSAQGNDIMNGADSDTKSNGTTFFFIEGDGTDTITNFEAYDVSRANKADVLSTYGQAVTGVYTIGEDLRVRVGNNDDAVRITNMKNKVIAVDFSDSIEGAQVGDNLTYDGFTKYYYGIGNATLNVTIDNYSDDINIWMDGSDGKCYLNDLKFIDASNSYKSAVIAGNAQDNIIIASSGKTSLWGGTGGDDTLTGGDGEDTFFYGYGGGDDLIDGVSSDDVIRAFNIDLSQITKIDVTATNININFNDGGKLRVNSENSGAKFVLDDGSVYVCDQVTRTWK